MDSQQHLTLPQKRLLVQQPSHLHKIKSRSAGKGNDAIWGSKERTLSSWDMSRNVPDSVTCPGWNTKVTYNPMVLVGNWAEERVSFCFTFTFFFKMSPFLFKKFYDFQNTRLLT